MTEKKSYKCGKIQLFLSTVKLLPFGTKDINFHITKMKISNDFLTELYYHMEEELTKDN